MLPGYLPQALDASSVAQAAALLSMQQGEARLWQLHRQRRQGVVGTQQGQ